jgi:hypothetical protein
MATADADLLDIELSRVDIIVWLSHITAPLIQILGVIVLYQISGSSPLFIAVWLVLWTVAMIIVRRITSLWRIRKNGTIVNKSKILRFCVAYTVLFSSCFAVILVMLNDLLQPMQYVLALSACVLP